MKKSERDISHEELAIAQGRVVLLTFAVMEVDGEVLDETWTVEHYGYVQGLGQMPAGFERGLEGLKAGEIFEFDVPSEQAYGKHNNQMVQKIAAEQLPAGLKPGMVVHMELPGHAGGAPPLVFHVKSLNDEGMVRLDGNHPFAGKDLRFMGKVRAVRVASPEELATGRIKRPV